MPTSTSHVVVVGAGIVGTASALELRRRGWRVTLVDPGPVPRPSATSVDISRIVRMDYGADRELTELARSALDGWELWNRTLFDRPLFHRTGFLLLSREPLAAGGFEHESLATLEALGEPAERLDPDVLAARFPLWSRGPWVDGYLSARAGWAEAAEAVAALARRAEHEGVRLVTRRAEGLVERGGRVCGVGLSGGNDVEGDAVVLATGAWTPGLLPELSPYIEPRAMPVLYFRPRDPARFRPPAFPVWAGDIAETGWYGFPATADGLVKLGHHGTGWAGDPERPGTVPGVWEARCRHFLTLHLPALAHAPLVRTRACYYADARDGDFWISLHPERPGLVVAAGGSGHGFKFGPVLGALVAAALDGSPDPRLTRFRWRPESPARREDARAESGMS
jgi:glycine/D-amino acid oxidase-like deaminating enzyme